jgi:sua5/yciO/yrdC/ywlC family protein
MSKIILFPTDTVYGIGSLPIQSEIQRLYDIKKREKNKKIIALVSSKEKVFEIFEYSSFIKFLVDKLFPGEVTLISKAKKDFLDKTGYIGDIGVRMPSNRLAQELIESQGGILMTTSANLSGDPTPKSFSEIKKEILERVDEYIEKDEDLSGVSSSIFKISDDNILEIREGNIKLEYLLALKEDFFEK